MKVLIIIISIFILLIFIVIVYYGPWWRHVNDYHELEESIFFVSYEELLTVN